MNWKFNVNNICCCSHSTQKKKGISLGGLFGNLKVNVDSYKEIIDEFKKIESFDEFLDFDTNKINWDEIAKSIGNCDETALSYFKTLEDANGTINNQSASIEGLGSHLKATGNSFSFAAIKATLLNTALNTSIFLAASMAIQGLIKVFDNWIHRVEKARERTDELFTEFKEINDTLADHKKTVAELASRYDELSKGVNLSNNANVSLSTEEYEEFLDINEQLAQSFPELAKGIDENGNSILTLGKNGITSKEQLEELLQTEEDLNNFRIAQELEDAFKGVYTYVEDANDATDKLNGSINDSSEAMNKLQEVAENGIKLSDDDIQLIFAGDINNQAESNYMAALKKSVNEFWKALDGSRRVELDTHGINDSNLFSFNYDEYTGAFEVYSQAFKLTSEERTALEYIIQDNVGDVSGALLDSISEQSQELQNQVQQGKNAWTDFIPVLVSGMKSKQTFKNLDSDLQDMAVQIVEGLDYSYATAMKEYDPDPYAYIRDKFIVPMGNLDKKDKESVKSSFNQLMELDTDDISQNNQAEIAKLINDIASLLNKDSMELRVILGFDVINDENYKIALREAKRQLDGYGHDDRGFETNNDTGKELDDFFEENVKTQDDIALWTDVTKGITDATDAMNAYTEAKKASTSLNDETPLSISETIDQLNTQLKPAMDSLKSVWNDIFTDGKMDLNSIDILSTCDTIKSKLDDMSELGLNVDYTAFEDFARVLTDTSSTALDVQRQFDSLAGTIVYATGCTEVNADTFNVLVQALEEMGLVNASDVLTEIMQAQEGFQEVNEQLGFTLEEVANATYAETVQMLMQAQAAGQDSQALWRLAVAQGTITDATIATESNIDALLAEAQAAGIDAAALTSLENVKNGNIKDSNAAKAIMEKAKKDIIESMSGFKLDFDFDTTVGSAGKAAKETQKEANIMSELKSEMDKLQSAYKSLCDIRDTYNEHGKITIDQYQELTDLGFGFLSTLVDENGQLGLNANAFEQLSNAKLQEMQIQLARNAVDTINGLKSEAEATEFLAYANEHLRDATLGAVEAQLRHAREEAHKRGEQQGAAADQIVNAYEATKQLVGKVEFGFNPSEMNKTAEDAKKSFMDAYNEEKKLLDHMKSMGEINNSEYYEKLMKLAEKYFSGSEEYRDNLWEVQEQYHDYLESIRKTYNWIENLLSSLSKKTNALISKAEKFISWQKKNAMLNRAIKASNNEITQNRNAYQIYMAKANSVGLSKNYVNKIQNGSLTIEDLSNEKLSGKIEKYQEWYDKAQAVSDTINDLYDKQRDLIRQKLDNVLDYYSDLDSYLSSVTSKIESIISLNNEMGKRTSLTELVEQFASLSDQLESVTTKKASDVTTTEGSFGSSKKVAEAMKRDREELKNSIQAEIDNLAPNLSGTYIKLENDIAGTIKNINKYVENGWDVTRSKQFDKLQNKLQNYYDLQNELDQYATSNTISNYSRVYTAYQKLQNKLDSGKNLTKTEQKRYDSYAAQIDALREQGASALNKLYDELAVADGSAEKESAYDNIKNKKDSIQSNLENSLTYKNLDNNIKKTESDLAEYGVDEDGNGYDKLTKKQKKKYDNLQKQLKEYNAKKEALDENATASNVAEYSKIYDAWRKLQDKLDSGGNLSTSQWQKYNQYTKQLEDYGKYKADTISRLEDELAAALEPGDKLEQIERAYEESAEGIYESYQSQIDDLNGDVTSTKQYQKLFAKAQQLEQKKDTKGLSKSEQASLDKYNAELEALREGGMSTNISDYMKTWEVWYSLEKKLEKNGKLSDKDAKNYDTYKAKLDAWNNEKQTQINDLLELMENDLEALNKTYTENISEAESEINDYYSNLYSLAKQIAEYNISSLQAQLTAIENCISYYKELVSLYDSFDGNKLVKILTDLGEIGASDEVSSRMDLYSGYLDKLQEKYDTTLSEINEYDQLLNALKTDNFESSMDVFNKAMEGYKESGNTAMAEKLQSVLDLLNERAIDSDNWGEYADEWANEWEEALSSAKQELIGTAKEIQEVNDALREIRFENITNAIDELEKASGILSSIEGLIKDDWLFEPDGSLSEYGRAKAALLVSQLEDAQSKANEYLKLYNEIQEEYRNGSYASDKAYKADSNEALQNYYDSLGNAASLENSILELMKKNSEEEINHLKDVIDARKKALQSKKEYYDYDKSIKNSQKEIDSLKAQRDAIKNLTDTTDAATKAKLAQLEAEIAEKEEALQETKDEHTFNLQIDALDKFSDSLSDALDESTKSVEEILQNQKEIIESAKELYKTSTDSVNETLDKLTSFYSGMGVTIDGMDLVPDTDISSDENTDDNTASAGLVPDNTKPSAVDKFIEEASEAFANGVLVRTSDAQMLRVYDQDMPAYMKEHLPLISTAVQPIPQYIEYAKERNDVSTVINNNHYDCLLKVEGNVDRNALPDLETILKESCRYTEADIYRQQMLLR